MPFLTGENAEQPHPMLFWRIGKKAALREGNFKILKDRAGKWELYDLENDISESTDLSKAQPEKLSALKLRWEEINGEMIDPVWTRNK